MLALNWSRVKHCRPRLPKLVRWTVKPTKPLSAGKQPACLKPLDRDESLMQTTGGLEDRHRIPLDVDEAGVGEDIEQVADPRGVGRAFEDEGPLPLERELACEVQQGSLPAIEVRFGK